MTSPADRRAQLEARNAEMRDRVETMLTDLKRRTAGLQEAQAQAAAVTAEAVSQDGLVRVRVNPTGVLTSLEFTQTAFQRSTPERLARSVIETVQKAAVQARQQVDSALAPLTDTSSVGDLSDLVEGAPSMKEFLRPPLPEVPQTAQSSAAAPPPGYGPPPSAPGYGPPPAAPGAPGGQPPRRPTRDDGDEGYGSVLNEDSW
jgi:DNA-binding protein YbaB